MTDTVSDSDWPVVWLRVFWVTAVAFSCVNAARGELGPGTMLDPFGCVGRAIIIEF